MNLPGAAAAQPPWSAGTCSSFRVWRLVAGGACPSLVCAPPPAPRRLAALAREARTSPLSESGDESPQSKAAAPQQPPASSLISTTSLRNQRRRPFSNTARRSKRRRALSARVASNGCARAGGSAIEQGTRAWNGRIWAAVARFYPKNRTFRPPDTLQAPICTSQGGFYTRQASARMHPRCDGHAPGGG